MYSQYAFVGVCPCTLLELHVGSPGQQPTGAISAHVMALTHKPSFGRSVSQKRAITDLNAPNGSRGIQFQSQEFEQYGCRHFVDF